LRPRWSPGLLHRDLTLGVHGHEGDALHVELLVLDELHEVVEVVLSKIGDQIRRDDDVELRVAHGLLLRSDRGIGLGVDAMGGAWLLRLLVEGVFVGSVRVRGYVEDDGRATLATASFRLATAATRMSVTRAIPWRSGADPAPVATVPGFGSLTSRILSRQPSAPSARRIALDATLGRAATSHITRPG
jgi:hypothetical protein